MSPPRVPTTLWPGPPGAWRRPPMGMATWTATSIARTRVTATTRETAPFGGTAPKGRVRRLAGVAGAPPRPRGRRLHRGPARAGRRGRRAGAQPGAPDHHGRAAPHLGQGSGRCAQHDDDHARLLLQRVIGASQERRPLRCRTRNGVRAGERGHAAEHAEPAERRRGPIRQDRADRFPDADRRPREAEPDGHAVDARSPSPTAASWPTRRRSQVQPPPAA